MKGDKGKKIKKFFTYLIGFYFLIFGALASCGEVMAATTTTPLPKEDYQRVVPKTLDPLKFTPQIPIPNTAITGTINVGEQKGKKMVSDLLPSYVGAFYQYGLTIVGILATVILMAGGIIWLTSAGNDSKVTQAKEMIFGSLAGVFLLFSSYLILETINPELVKLKGIESEKLDEVVLDYVCCQATSSASTMLGNDCHDMGGKRMTGYMPVNGVCVKEGCCLLYTDDSKTTLDYCQDSIESSCSVNYNQYNYNPSYSPGGNDAFSGKNSYSWEKGSCVSNKKCGNNIKYPCEKSEDGDNCGIGTNSGHCYGQKCYIGDGRDGEPCGNKEGSICGESGSCKNQDGGGGRSCIGDCCEKVQPNGCAGKADGSECNNNTSEGYCYDSQCLVGDGKGGQRCGDPKNKSVCVHEDKGSCENWDTTSNTRSCTKDTWCCVGGVYKIK